MQYIKLHDNGGKEVLVNVERAFVIEPYKYGNAKLTRLYFDSGYAYTVLEKPEEILNETVVDPSVIYARAHIFKKEIAEKSRNERMWRAWQGGEQCDT